MSPLIYGLGTGYFNRLSIQVPSMIRAALKTKQAEVIGDGKGVWDHVHVEDLALLYEISVVKILAGELGSGEKGVYFSENGQHTWREVAEGVADALRAQGVRETEQVKSVTLDEGAKKGAGGDKLLAELGFASNSRIKSEVSRRRGDRDFKNHFQAEVEEILKQQKK